MPTSRPSSTSPSPAPHADEKIRVGVSACLLGEKVRFDSGHKHDRFVTDVLGEHFEFVPVCPEVEAGMGIPRESVRLVRAPSGLRMLGVKTGKDHTKAVSLVSERRAVDMRGRKICGYILKKGSPSCGMERVRSYTEGGMPAPSTRGLFADALMRALPDLPVEEEGRLIDPVLRESFIERVFAYARVQTFFDARWTVGNLVAFHTREKMLIASHEPAAEKILGRLVAAAASTPRAQVATSYREVFLGALAKPARRARHVNVLQHMLGHFREAVAPEARQSLARVIEEYRTGLVPLVVPITLLRHYVEVCGVNYLAGQSYLEPHPRELLLRNHV